MVPGHDRGQRLDQMPNGPDLSVHGEAPVQQAGSVGHLGQRCAVEDRHHQRGVSPPGPADERRLGRGGPADLATEVPPERGQHRVLAVKGDHAVAVMPGAVRPERETERQQPLVVHERGYGQRPPGEQRLVVRGDMLASGVEPVRRHGHRVVRAQVACLRVDHRHAPGVRPGRLREGDRRVVCGNHQQRLEQIGDPVAVAGDQPDLARLDGGGPARCDHGGVRLERLHQGDGGEHLQRAGGPVKAVRVLGGQHLAGARVGDDVRGGPYVGEPPPAAGRIVHDHSPPGQLPPAERCQPRVAAGRRPRAGSTVVRGGARVNGGCRARMPVGGCARVLCSLARIPAMPRLCGGQRGGAGMRGGAGQWPRAGRWSRVGPRDRPGQHGRRRDGEAQGGGGRSRQPPRANLPPPGRRVRRRSAAGRPRVSSALARPQTGQPGLPSPARPASAPVVNHSE